MADMTDSPFCQTVKEVGSPTVFREMVSSEAVVRGNDKTLGMTAFDESERPIVQQIFGCDPATMAEAARIIMEQHAPDGIDINMGCPVYKITSNFNGAALMKEPTLAMEIVQAIKRAVTVPVSVKIRTGWDNPTECLAFARVLQDAGADLLTVHGRTKKQAYAGYSDWGMIRSVKECVSIPVLANGDIFSAQDAKRALNVTQTDGVLIARGCLGNPWIFPQIEEVLAHGEMRTQPTLRDHAQLILRHAKRHMHAYGPRGMTSFRKHLSWYSKGIAGAKEIRLALVRVSTLSQLETILAPWLTDLRPLNTQRLVSPQPTDSPYDTSPYKTVAVG